MQTNLQIAHKIEISGTVGGTMHIEPNDTPKAGESNLVWFALTRQGGTSIPLTSCNCSLQLYSQPRTGEAPLQEPVLQAVDAEGYQGIPGAEISFPQVGAYDLVMTGEPIASQNFQPFELTFSVTVAVASKTNSEPKVVDENIASIQPSESLESLPNQDIGFGIPSLWVGFSIGLGAIALGIIWFRRKNSSS